MRTQKELSEGVVGTGITIVFKWHLDRYVDQKVVGGIWAKHGQVEPAQLT